MTGRKAYRVNPPRWKKALNRKSTTARRRGRGAKNRTDSKKRPRTVFMLIDFSQEQEGKIVARYYPQNPVYLSPEKAMSTSTGTESSDDKLKDIAARMAQTPPPETPEGSTLREVREHLAKGAVDNAQRLARTLEHTYSYPAAMIAVAEAQHRAGQSGAAHQTLSTAQRQVQQFYKGDHWNGYPRATYLLDLVRAQVAVGDVAGATRTAQLIDRPEEHGQALRLLREQAASATGTGRKDAGPA